MLPIFILIYLEKIYIKDKTFSYISFFNNNFGFTALNNFIKVIVKILEKVVKKVIDWER